MHKTPGFLKRPVRIVQQSSRLARFCSRTTPVWSADYPRLLLHALCLCWRQGYSPKEAFRLGLLNANLPAGELSKNISRKKLTELQQSLNPVSWVPLVRDKAIFYQYCTALDIPVPKLYAVFCRPNPWWAHQGRVLSSRCEWIRFFNLDLPAEFVIKPAHGAFGRGLNILSRTDGGFVGPFKSYKAEDLYEAMHADPEFDSFVIQQRLQNHPEILRLTGTTYLQTVRIVTLVDASSASRILYADMKLIMGTNIIDNVRHGLTGNVSAPVSVKDGLLKHALMFDAKRPGARTIHVHPKTAVPLDGFTLPCWFEASELVKQAALKFLPLRAIGWDVAITPDGPCILEANSYWDPPTPSENVPAIIDALSSNLPAPGQPANR